MTSNSTIDTYNKYHQIYDDETIEFWKKFPKIIINRFVSELPGNKILDLGSGPGRNALLLKEKGLEVTCLDASEEMIKRTQELGFYSILQNMLNLSFSKSSFDGAWAYTSLIHIPKDDVKLVLEKLHTILKQDGILLLGMIEGEFEGDIERKRCLKYTDFSDITKKMS